MAADSTDSWAGLSRNATRRDVTQTPYTTIAYYLLEVVVVVGGILKRRDRSPSSQSLSRTFYYSIYTLYCFLSYNTIQSSYLSYLGSLIWHPAGPGAASASAAQTETLQTMLNCAPTRRASLPLYARRDLRIRP